MGVNAALPRLAVIGDVCPERVAGGSLLLYRLLNDYPADRLRVVYNPDHAGTDEAVRLPRVQYRILHYRVPRWIRNRLNPAWPVVMAGAMRWYTRAVMCQVREFDPEAILTIPHWYLWFSAAAAARRLGIPLYLMVHDDWPSFQTFRRPGPVWDAVRWGARRTLGKVYRQAAVRFCVSPGMMEYCRGWFGVDGTVLYPSRGEDSPACQVRVRSASGEKPVVAFCGNIHQDGTTVLLRKLADTLARLGGFLDLYTLVAPEQLAAQGLRPPTVRVWGFLPPTAMAERIAEAAHALFLPASFEPREHLDVETLFPSKLADYTAIGLPVLVWGPASSSAARWAAENPGATVLGTDPDPAWLGLVLVRLAADPAYAAQVAAAGIEAGKRYFELARARETFFAALSTRGVRARDKC